MFYIKNRQRPVFSLLDIETISKICSKVFCKEIIEYKNLKAFELQYSARINEINQQIFLVESGKWEINIEKYRDSIVALDLLVETKKAIESIFGTTVSTLKVTNIDAASERLFGMNEVLYDLRGLSEVKDKLPPGDHFCIVEKANIPLDLLCFAGFNSDILVEYELNKFHFYETGVSEAIAIVKI
jgi:hypothetical protein